jgi:hypothetical protein
MYIQDVFISTTNRMDVQGVYALPQPAVWVDVQDVSTYSVCSVAMQSVCTCRVCPFPPPAVWIVQGVFLFTFINIH